MTRRRRSDALTVASLAFAASILLHGADHVRRGSGSLTREVFWGGAVLALVNFTTVSLALRRHPRAPLFCAIVGVWTALGVSASHLAPHWSAFSNPYRDLSLDGFAWAAMLSEVAAALVLAAVAITRLRGAASRQLVQA